MWWFRRKELVVDEPSSIWKNDFSDCLTEAYLSSYSICQNQNNARCRFIVYYAGMSLCSNPQHKTFSPESSAPNQPLEN